MNAIGCFFFFVCQILIYVCNTLNKPELAIREMCEPLNCSERLIGKMNYAEYFILETKQVFEHCTVSCRYLSIDTDRQVKNY